MIHFPHHFPHYFKHRLSPQLKGLYLTAAMMDFAAAAITLFEPIYLWTLGYRIPEIMLFYLMVYGAYFLLLPLGGKFVARFGPERSILISTIWLVGYFALLIGIGSFASLFWVAPILFALQKTFYWPAYHFDFLRFSAKQDRGEEFSGLWTVTVSMYVLGPVVGGLVVNYFGFPAMFTGAAVIILFSSWPLFKQRLAAKVEEFSYWKSFILPFRRRYIRNTIGYLGLGEELLGMTIWPIFILLVYGNVFNLGILVGASALVTSVSTLAVGKLTDRISKRKVYTVSSLIQSGLWFIRLALRQTVPVFITDVAGRSVHTAVFVSLTTMTYERAHADDFSWHGVYYEQGFALAKTLMALVVMLLAAAFNPFELSFVLAGIASFLYLVW